MELTAYSLRFAPASSSSSCLALAFQMLIQEFILTTARLRV